MNAEGSIETRVTPIASGGLVRRLPAMFCAVIAASLVLTSIGGPAASAQGAPPAAAKAVHAARATASGRPLRLPRTVTRAVAYQGGPASARVQPQATVGTTPLAVTAPNVTVTYTGFPATAKAAFQAAVDIWKTNLRSAAPILIDASWTDMTAQFGDSSILASSGPTDFVANFQKAPRQNVYYPVALANAISGTDQEPVGSPNSPDGSEISAEFNSNPGALWYLGTDSRPISSQEDLETVVLHELGHGFGFVGSFDGINENTGLDDGKGYYGLSGDGTDPTIFDTFATDGNGVPLTPPTYPSGSVALGKVLRGSTGGARWGGAFGMVAAGGLRPTLYSPATWQPGSSFSHLDESVYPPGSGNALMTPGVTTGEVDHAPGPIMLGMFRDMGWPSTALPTLPAAAYHSAVPYRLASQAAVTSAKPLTVQVTGRDGVPANATAVAVSVEVKAPTARGYWSVLPGFSGGPGKPDTMDYPAVQTRISPAVLPVDGFGQVRVWPSGGSSTVNVDLVGWYATGGAFYHHLQNQQVAQLKSVSSSAAVNVPVLGRAGFPTTGVTSVVLKVRVSAGTSAGWLFVGPANVANWQIPTSAFGKGEMISTFAIVLLSDAQVRLRLTSGTATVSLEAIGWYSSSAGQRFHPAAPVRAVPGLRGQEVTVGGMPANSQVMLDVHLANPTASGWLGSAPAGHPTLHGVQEYHAGQPVSGTIITTTNATGQVRLHLSAGVSTMYVDYLGYFLS
jgi:hypothetical protein